jgi:hypothetical protein
MNHIQIRELIYRHFENDLSTAEEETLKRELKEDPIVKKEWESIRDVIGRTEKIAAVEPPEDFTSAILSKVSPKKVPLWKKTVKVFFKPHTLRLNVALEACAAVLIVAAGTLLFNAGAVFEARSIPGIAHDLDVTRPILTRFHVYLPEADSVHVAGSFNDWKNDELELADINGDGFWMITLPLPPGRHSYMFFADGTEWLSDPSAETLEGDGSGNENSVIEVSTENLVRFL